jgi:hypothetical protein
MTTVDLSSELRQLSLALRQLEKRLQSRAAPDSVVLNEFRQTIDNVRLAWSISELINAQHIRKNQDTVLAFLAAERLRPFDQMVRTLCADMENRIITGQTNGVESVLDSVETLHTRLRQCCSERKCKV